MRLDDAGMAVNLAAIFMTPDSPDPNDRKPHELVFFALIFLGLFMAVYGLFLPNGLLIGIGLALSFIGLLWFYFGHPFEE